MRDEARRCIRCIRPCCCTPYPPGLPPVRYCNALPVWRFHSGIQIRHMLLQRCPKPARIVNRTTLEIRNSVSPTSTLSEPEGSVSAICLLMICHYRYEYTRIYLPSTNTHAIVRLGITCLSAASYDSCIYRLTCSMAIWVVAPSRRLLLVKYALALAGAWSSSTVRM